MVSLTTGSGAAVRIDDDDAWRDLASASQRGRLSVEVTT
jgi:hypothetical protein